MISRPFSCLLAVSLVVVPARVFAQSTGETRRAAAEALFIEGRRLVDEGKTAEGCAKFAESQALDPGVGTLLNLARCYERIGRTASAWTTYREAAGRAHAAGQFQRETAARDEAERLANSIPKVEIAMAPENREKGLALTLDGEPWSNSLLGVPFPADPGRHELVARAPGFEDFSATFEAAPGQVTLVRVPPLKALPKARVASPPPDPGEPWRVTHTFAVASTVVAVTAATFGTVFALDARDTYDEAEKYCTGNQCEQPGLELRDDAFDRAALANIAFSVAGAAAVSAAVLWFTRPPPDRLPWQSTAASARVGSSPRLEIRW